MTEVYLSHMLLVVIFRSISSHTYNYDTNDRNDTVIWKQMRNVRLEL